MQNTGLEARVTASGGGGWGRRGGVLWVVGWGEEGG